MIRTTRIPIQPQPTHRLVEGLAHVTIGMNPADDGAVWYDADCINPGREVRCPWGGPGCVAELPGVTGRQVVVGITAERSAAGPWEWVIEHYPEDGSTGA